MIMSGYSIFAGRNIDEDWVDRLNGHWTVLLISAMSVGTFLARFLFSAITCMTPAHATNSFTRHAHQICLHKGTYYAISNTVGAEAAPNLVVSWHMWFPLILFLQAFAFKAPNLIWNLFKQPLIVNMNQTVTTLATCQAMNPEKRWFLFKDTALLLSKSATNRCIVGIIYLLVKFLFCVNLMAQFVFLTVVVKDQIGIDTKATEISYSNYTLVPAFPKTVMCDFEISVIRNIQRYTLMCELSINYEFEKCYVFLWFWVLGVFLISSVNLFLWIIYLLIPCVKEWRITAYVNAFNSQPGVGAGLSKAFISNFLGVDGVLLITMISRNSSEMVAADLTRHLFEIYQETHTGMTLSAQSRPLQPAYPVQTGSYTLASAPSGGYAGSPQSVPMATFRQGTHTEAHEPLVAREHM